MGTTFLFMIAVLFLTTGTIGGVRAAPQIFNPDFAYSGVELDQIGITLLENGQLVASRNYDKTLQRFDPHSNDENGEPKHPEMGILMQGILGSDEKLKLGKDYSEVLSVQNTGSIPEYVRVTIYKYWADSKGNHVYAVGKDNKPISNLIQLTLASGWKEDVNSRTDERMVLYYQNALKKDESKDITKTLRIDNSIIDYGEKVYRTEGNETSWEWKWVADGLKCMLEVEVDGVQDHAARAAMKSAWGLTDADISRLGLNVT